MARTVGDGNSKAMTLLRKFRTHYKMLGVSNDEEFFIKMGKSTSTFRNWYTHGVGRIYVFIEELLNTIAVLEKDLHTLRMEKMRAEMSNKDKIKAAEDRLGHL